MSSMHTEEQMRAKQNAIDMAVDAFTIQYMEGRFDYLDEQFLYHAIENLNSLVVELKRG